MGLVGMGMKVVQLEEAYEGVYKHHVENSNIIFRLVVLKLQNI